MSINIRSTAILVTFARAEVPPGTRRPPNPVFRTDPVVQIARRSHHGAVAATAAAQSTGGSQCMKTYLLKGEHRRSGEPARRGRRILAGRGRSPCAFRAVRRRGDRRLGKVVARVSSHACALREPGPRRGKPIASGTRAAAAAASPASAPCPTPIPPIDSQAVYPFAARP